MMPKPSNPVRPDQAAGGSGTPGGGGVPPVVGVSIRSKALVKPPEVGLPLITNSPPGPLGPSKPQFNVSPGATVPPLKEIFCGVTDLVPNGGVELKNWPV